MTMDRNDLDDLRRARELLENPGLPARLAELIGTPIEKGLEMLPANWSAKVAEATQTALLKAVDVASGSLDARGVGPSKNRLHKLAVGASGAVGGAFGLAALTLELPISTTVMLRSIADIARSEGETVSDPETKMACISVFALGGRAKDVDAAESGYFAVRIGLNQMMKEAAQHLAKGGLARKMAPAVLRFVEAVAARFGIVVTEKAAAQALPLVGAAGGATINVVFIDHFQNIARGHFIVRRLERHYGSDVVREAYEALDR